MNDRKQGVYCTIDHSNKRGDSRDYDPYHFWLKQMKLRQQMEAAAEEAVNNDAGTHPKSQLA